MFIWNPILFFDISNPELDFMENFYYQVWSTKIDIHEFLNYISVHSTGLFLFCCCKRKLLWAFLETIAR